MHPIWFWLFLIGILPPAASAQVLAPSALEQETDSLMAVSRALTDQKKYDSAFKLTEMAEKRVLETLDSNSVLYAKVCANYGRIYYRKGGPANFVEAEKWYQQSKTICEKELGKEHPMYALSLYRLSVLYKVKGEYKKAEPLLQEAISIQVKALGKEHKDYIESIRALQGLYYDTGELEKSMALALEIRDILKKTSGQETPEYAESLNSIALLYVKQSAYNQALALHLEALGIRERVLGKDKAPYAWSLNNLAMVYTHKGQYQKALPLYLEAQAIMLATEGKENKNFSIMLKSCGNAYQLLGRYDEAEAAYIESAEIIKRCFGAEHPDYALALSYLGRLYFSNGDYEKAFKLFTEASVIQEKALGPENIQYANTLFQIALLYNKMGQFDRARETGQKVKDIWGKKLGENSTAYSSALQFLAETEMNVKAYDKAQDLLTEALDIREKIQGKTHRDYIRCIQVMARLYMLQGADEKALTLFLEVNNRYNELLGKQHFDYAGSLYQTAMLYNKMEQYDKAAEYFQDYNETALALLDQAETYSSEKEMLQKQSMFANRLSSLYQFVQHHPNDSLFCRAYNTALYLNNGLLFNAMARERSLDNADKDTRAIYEEWQSLNFQLYKLYVLPKANRDSTLISALETQANELEKEIARRTETFVNTSKKVQWFEIKQKLQPGEAAIEFVHFPYSIPEKKDSTLYGALILRPDDKHPQFVPLFEKQALLAVMQGAAGGNNFLKINELYTLTSAKSKQKNAYQLIWKPLETYLSDIKTVYCAPSGLLYYLNLAAIPVNEHQTFGDLRHLVILGSTRHLVTRTETTQYAVNDAYLAGGIRYEIAKNGTETYSKDLVTRYVEQSGAPSFYADSIASRAGNLRYLPATAIEVHEIGQMLREANFATRVDTGFLATEESITGLGRFNPSPRILHIATHGYFFPNPKKNLEISDQEPAFRISEHPMIRSGLLMAGSKQTWLTGKQLQGQEDGILTAYEISQMKLSNTELVVLSACETGLGDIAGYEGVYGLQRAFKLAGARYLIMSLWKVDDRSTKAFMAEFYKQWLQRKQSIPMAFSATQKVMRSRNLNPYDWAGFVLIE